MPNANHKTSDTPAANVRRVPISDKQRRLMNSPTIASQLPMVFPNGNTVDVFSGYCFQCNKEMDSHSLHGKITWVLDTVATIEAVGVCTTCNLLTPFNSRQRQDFSMEWINREGVWCKVDKYGVHPLGAEEPKTTSALSTAVIGWTLFLAMMLPMVIAAFKIVPRG